MRRAGQSDEARQNQHNVRPWKRPRYAIKVNNHGFICSAHKAMRWAMYALIQQYFCDKSEIVLWDIQNHSWLQIHVVNWQKSNAVLMWIIVVSSVQLTIQWAMYALIQQYCRDKSEIVSWEIQNHYWPQIHVVKWQKSNGQTGGARVDKLGGHLDLL